MCVLLEKIQKHVASLYSDIKNNRHVHCLMINKTNRTLNRTNYKYPPLTLVYFPLVKMATTVSIMSGIYAYCLFIGTTQK